MYNIYCPTVLSFMSSLPLSGHRESCTHFLAQRRIGFGPISTHCSQQRYKRNLETSSKARCPDTFLNEQTAGGEEVASTLAGRSLSGPSDKSTNPNCFCRIHDSVHFLFVLNAVKSCAMM